MCKSPHATNFCWMSTFQSWRLLFIWYWSGNILCLWWIHLVCRGIQMFVLTRHILDHCRDFVKFRFKLIFFLIRSSPVVTKFIFHNKELVIRLVTYLFCLIGILKLEVWRSRWQKQENDYEKCYYLAQANINKQTPWCNNCVQNMIWFEEFWKIGN